MRLAVLSVISLFVFGLLAACNGKTPVLNPAPAKIYNFGNVYVGTSKSSPAFTWKNTSGQTLNTISMVPTPIAGPFLYTPAFVGAAIPDGGSTTAFNLTFTPTAAGKVTGTITPGINEPQFKVQGVEVSGTGVFQDAGGTIGIGRGNLVPGQALDFGSVTLPGGQPVVKQFNLSNRAGANPVTLTASWFKGAPFTVTAPPLPLTIPAGGSATIKITFTPTAIGDYKDAVTFKDGNTPVVNFAGTAVVGRAVPPGGG